MIVDSQTDDGRCKRCMLAVKVFSWCEELNHSLPRNRRCHLFSHHYERSARVFIEDTPESWEAFLKAELVGDS